MDTTVIMQKETALSLRPEEDKGSSGLHKQALSSRWTSLNLLPLVGHK